MVANHHPLLDRSSLTRANPKDTPFVLFETGFALSRIILDDRLGHGFEPDIAAQSGQIDFIVELAASGLGVAFLPRIIAEQEESPGLARILLAEPRTEWRLATVRWRGAHLSHACHLRCPRSRRIRLRTSNYYADILSLPWAFA